MWQLDCEESWAPKNWCFWIMVLEKTLESPLNCKETNQSILKQISPEYSLEGLMLKLKLQYFGHLMLTADSWKGPDSGEDWRQEEKGTTEDEMVGWHLPTRQTWVWANSRIWQWTGKPSELQSMGSQRAGHDWATELNLIFHCIYVCKELDITEQLDWTEYSVVFMCHIFSIHLTAEDI